ncbi:MAG: DUF983 domain-containing protein [Maritimibacter sp.]
MSDPIEPSRRDASDLRPERALKPAIWRGWRRKCPNCGTGPLMKSYLKVNDSCSVCGEELHHQRADDGPAYLTILAVGHVMAPCLHIGFVQFRPDPLVFGAILGIGTVALSLYLLPRFKGFMVGFQWAKRMHGFANGDAELSDPAA